MTNQPFFLLFFPQNHNSQLEFLVTLYTFFGQKYAALKAGVRLYGNSGRKIAILGKIGPKSKMAIFAKLVIFDYRQKGQKLSILVKK